MGADFSTNAPRVQHDPINSLGEALPATPAPQPRAKKTPSRATQRSDQDYLNILLQGEKPSSAKNKKVTSSELKGVLLSPAQLKAQEEKKAQSSAHYANREAKPKQDEHNEAVAQVRVFEKWHREHPNATDHLCRMAGVPPRKQVQELRRVIGANEAHLQDDVKKPKTELVAVSLDSKEYKEAFASLPKRETALERHNDFAEKVAIFTKWERQNPNASDKQRVREGIPPRETVEKWRNLVASSEARLIRQS